MTTRGSRSNSSAWRTPTSPTRSSEPQSEMTTRSYGAAGSGSVLNRSTPSMKSYRAGHRVRAHRIGRAAERLDEPDDAERRAERVGVGVLVADRQHAPRAAQPVDDGLRDGVEVGVEIDASRGPLARAGRLAWRVGRAASVGRGRGGTGGRTADGGSSGRSSGWPRRGTGVGSDSAIGAVRIGHAPGLELGQQLEDPRAALGGVVEVDVQVRDPPDPQPPAQLVADERHRVPRSAAIAASRSAAWPITLTQTLAWRRSCVVSTDVIVANPIRGSATSLARIAPISCRRSSSTRSVRWLMPTLPSWSSRAARMGVQAKARASTGASAPKVRERTARTRATHAWAFMHVADDVLSSRRRGTPFGR